MIINIVRHLKIHYFIFGYYILNLILISNLLSSYHINNIYLKFQNILISEFSIENMPGLNPGIIFINRFRILYEDELLLRLLFVLLLLVLFSLQHISLRLEHEFLPIHLERLCSYCQDDYPSSFCN